MATNTDIPSFSATEEPILNTDSTYFCHSQYCNWKPLEKDLSILFYYNESFGVFFLVTVCTIPQLVFTEGFICTVLFWVLLLSAVNKKKPLLSWN